MRVALEAGRKYALRVEYRQTGAGGTIQLAWTPPADATLSEAVALAKGSDVAVVFVGLSSELEGEEMRGVNIPGFRGGDRTSLDLPEPQENLVKATIATGKPVVVVLTSGSALAANFAAERAAAVLAAWYGGEEAGTAIAETLAGVNNPAGRLPVTFYRGVDQLPPFTDYAMKGRTYRYFKGEPLYPFGFGLSYSTFAYSGLSRAADGERRRDPRNGQEHVRPGRRRGGPAVRRRRPREEAPVRSLRGFQRIHLRAGESREVTFTLASDDLPKSAVDISVGGGQPVAGHAARPGLVVALTDQPRGPELTTMRAAVIAGLAGLGCGTAVAQQANVNLDWNPQKNTQNLTPFGANVISPEVRDDRTVTFRVKAPAAQEVLLSASTMLHGASASGRSPGRSPKGGDGVWTLTIGPAAAEHLRLQARHRRRAAWPIRTTP